jgi:adenylate cyclase
MSLPHNNSVNQNSRRLKLPPGLEVKYRADTNRRLMQIARPGTFLAILTYLSFWILDVYALPEAYPIVRGIRIVGILLMSVLFAWSFTALYERWVVLIFTLACLVVNLSVVATFAVTHSTEVVYYFYYLTLFFVILGAPILGMPFLNQVLVCICTLIAYLIVALFIQDMLQVQSSSVTFVASLFFLTGGMVIGSFGAYSAELVSRQDFLLRIMIDQERERSEELLLNILPAPIAERLKRGEVVADHIDSASVLFADIVDFTPLSARYTAVELVSLLNRIFSHFDNLVDRYSLEKIKTIGDCYMVAAGVPVSRIDHALVLAKLALEMQEYMAANRFDEGQRLYFRIGIHSGSLVAGIIGKRKFIYDLWGDTVNTASRMESHGVGGVIQISRATYELIKDDYICESKGSIQVKGKGEMEIWHIIEARPGAYQS